MNILITGVAGFIGFNVAKKILDKTENYVIGIDNINDYYDKKLKKNRLVKLKKYKKFIFFKKDLAVSNFNYIEKKISLIIHLAAQAGVRHSVEYPREYIDSNVNGFFNILEFAKIKKIKKIIYASSSSVYGDTKKFPSNEKDAMDPSSMYAASKEFNERLADLYHKFYGINLIGLRFFTIFGEWGRPDMFIGKYIDCAKKKKIFYLNGSGKHLRDFTYIDDVCEIIKKMVLRIKKINKHDIYNICSNNPVDLRDVIKEINKFFKPPKIIKRGYQMADVYKTHGDNKKVLKDFNFKKFTPIKISLRNTIFWYKNN